MKKPPTILLVDDDEDDRFFLSEALREVNPKASLKQLGDGVEALNFLQKECGGENPTSDKPDIIFLDLNMARIDGRTATKIIKNSKELCHIPVVIVTTSQNEQERENLIKLGANAFYTKPTSLPELKDIVQEVYDRFLAA